MLTGWRTLDQAGLNKSGKGQLQLSSLSVSQNDSQNDAAILEGVALAQFWGDFQVELEYEFESEGMSECVCVSVYVSV